MTKCSEKELEIQEECGDVFVPCGFSQKYVNNQESRVAHLCSPDSFLYHPSLALTDKLITNIAKGSGAQKHGLVCLPWPEP